MRIRDGDMSSDSARTVIDRQAVIAAGQLLMSAIWLEHRVRRFSKRRRMLPSQHPLCLVVSTSASHRLGPRVLVPEVGTTDPPHQEKGRTNDNVPEDRIRIEAGGRF
jgi:hypothetical protein